MDIYRNLRKMNINTKRNSIHHLTVVCKLLIHDCCLLPSLSPNSKSQPKVKSKIQHSFKSSANNKQIGVDQNLMVKKNSQKRKMHKKLSSGEQNQTLQKCREQAEIKMTSPRRLSTSLMSGLKERINNSRLTIYLSLREALKNV